MSSVGCTITLRLVHFITALLVLFNCVFAEPEHINKVLNYLDEPENYSIRPTCLNKNYYFYTQESVESFKSLVQNPVEPLATVWFTASRRQDSLVSIEYQYLADNYYLTAVKSGINTVVGISFNSGKIMLYSINPPENLSFGAEDTNSDSTIDTITIFSSDNTIEEMLVLQKPYFLPVSSDNLQACQTQYSKYYRDLWSGSSASKEVEK
ncbi:MAG: hypothetical protein HQL32_06690 [Planctomycetes bacterium]|nr:hypothetical protein [Planctomycetota bacterium]